MKLCAQKITKNFIRERADTNIFSAVNEAELELEGGKLVVLSGPSGSGKSTLLNMLAGLLVPSEGKVMLDDTDIYSLDDKELSLLRNKSFGIIPQGQTALQALTVLENVLVPYSLYGKNKGGDYEKARSFAAKLLEMAGIADLKNVMPSELSGGELRRMSVCRAMMNKPGVILADEPTGDLDEENTELVMKLLKANAENGACVLVVTHDPQVHEYADIQLEMRKGILTVIK